MTSVLRIAHLRIAHQGAILRWAILRVIKNIIITMNNDEHHHDHPPQVVHQHSVHPPPPRSSRIVGESLSHQLQGSGPGFYATPENHTHYKYRPTYERVKNEDLHCCLLDIFRQKMYNIVRILSGNCVDDKS